MALATVVLLGAWVQKSPCLHPLHRSSGQRTFPSTATRATRTSYRSTATEGFEQKWAPSPTGTTGSKNRASRTQHRHYMEYPVLTGVYMWVNAQITHGYRRRDRLLHLPTQVAPECSSSSTSCAFFASLFWLLSVWCVTRMTRQPVGRADRGALPARDRASVHELRHARRSRSRRARSSRGHVSSTLAGVLIGLGHGGQALPRAPDARAARALRAQPAR